MLTARLLAATALCAVGSLAIVPAVAAQEEDDSKKKQVIEEVVVTGTYLSGRSQFTNASPLAVIDSTSLRNIGAANFADLVQTLTINAGSQNNPDAFTQNGTTGTSNFNLRGLGVASTLVLLDGRRQVTSGALTNDGVAFVDLSSMIPQIAMKRLEIVKDGAAALYGSDAVAGVVNYITDDEFEGISLRARGSTLTDEGSQEDLLFEAKYGWGNDKTNIMLAASYYDRTPLTTAERRLSRRFGEDPNEPAGDDSSLLGNPGTFFLGGALPVVDPTGCEVGNGVVIPNAGAQAVLDASGLPFTGGFCGLDFGDFFNLVPEEERIQGYASVKHRFSDALQLKGSFSFANNESSRGNTPSFPFLQLGSAVVPADHPNNVFAQLLPAPVLADFQPTLFLGRAIGVDGGPANSNFTNDTYRFNIEAKGDLGNGWEYNIAYTYAETENVNVTPDTVTDRFARSLQGLGGDNCTGTTPGANGCEYFNPFSTRLTTAPNSQAVLDYIIQDQVTVSESELSVIDAVISGGLFDLPAGEVGVAIGFQLRDESFNRTFDDISQNDGFAFVIGGQDFGEQRDPYAVFVETVIPLAEGLELQGAARFEDYGGVIGDTLDPKVSILWEATDSLTFRGSFSTSFRAPSVFQQFGVQTSLNEVDDPVSGGSFFAATRNVNPGPGGRPVTPEESNAINAGFSFRDSGWKLDFDFWRYDFSNVIIQENFQAVVNADAEAGGTTGRVIRAAGPGSNILFVFVDFVNASSVETTGMDLSLKYTWDTEYGTFEPFIEGTYVFSYDIDDPQAGEISGAGNRNFTNFGSPTPELRFNTGVSWVNDYQSFRVFGRYIDGLNDDQNGGIDIDSMFTVDAQYTLDFGLFDEDWEGIGLSLGMINAFDETPPQVFTNGGFESRTHDPRGRVAYLELTARF